MERLGFQDAAFLRLEAPDRPYHVGGLMVFAPPERAGRDYLRRLVRRVGEQLPALDPVFRRQLDPAHPAAPRWIEASDIDPSRHLLHYALPQPGRMDDLLQLVSRAHERVLDRSGPLWEWHFIEGLPGGRFALYAKLHHALADGMGALRLLERLLSTNPHEKRIAARAGQAHRAAAAAAGRADEGWLHLLGQGAEALREQGRALPELAELFRRMGREQGEGKPPLPFTAPRTPINLNISGRRRVVVAELPLAAVRRAGAAVGATVNDVLLAVSGAALREYLREHGLLPPSSLLAGVPVSLKDASGMEGNQLSTLVCSFETRTADPLHRLRAITRCTRRAKQDLRGLSRTARADYMNLVLGPAVLLTLAHAATAVPPPFNVIVSNVPGPARPVYLAGARLESIYPLSVVTDAMAMNITAVSCGGRLCVAVTTCPDALPGIGDFGNCIRRSWRELAAALR